jgi:predicted MFS family arabinose efflux permease
MPKVMKTNHDLFSDESVPFKGSLANMEQFVGSMTNIAHTKDGLWKTLVRLFKNKLLMFNTISAIFYILGASAYFTYMSKYLEVQFHKSAADATIVTGKIKIILINYLI